MLRKLRRSMVREKLRSKRGREEDAETRHASPTSFADGDEMIESRSPAKAKSKRAQFTVRSGSRTCQSEYLPPRPHDDDVVVGVVFFFVVTIDRDFDAFSLSRASFEDAPKTPFGATIGDSARCSRRVERLHTALTYDHLTRTLLPLVSGLHYFATRFLRTFYSQFPNTN